MDTNAYYRIEQADQVSPLLWHRYFRPSNTRPYQGAVRGNFMCWSRPVEVKVASPHLSHVGNPILEAELRYLHRVAGQRYDMPHPYRQVYAMGYQLRGDILNFGQAMIPYQAQPHSLYFLGEADLEAFLQRFPKVPATTHDHVVSLWREMEQHAQDLTQAERHLFGT